jgi:hypothetical protein
MRKGAGEEASGLHVAGPEVIAAGDSDSSSLVVKLCSGLSRSFSKEDFIQHLRIRDIFGKYACHSLSFNPAWRWGWGKRRAAFRPSSQGQPREIEHSFTIRDELSLSSQQLKEKDCDDLQARDSWNIYIYPQS